MEVVNFKNKYFNEILKEDNPAYGSVECIMIVRAYPQGMYSVLHIIPVENPLEDESVNRVCACYSIESAEKIAQLLTQEKVKI